MVEQPNSVVIEDLTKRFGDFVAVDRLNLAVRKGEVFGFLGPNGAGKSTTIRMLCGLLKPTAGRAQVAGFDVGRDPEAVRQNIGYMSQKFSLYNDLKAIENLRLFAGLYSVPAKDLQNRIEWALEMANLKGQENLITGTLPGGWKQRLALGCAVLHRPPIIFLDEPTSGVDPISRRQFWDLIHQMAQEGVTVFVTTHYMEEAEYCNRLALIFHGKIVALGTPTELKRDSMKGELLLIECEPLGDAVEALQSAPEVKDAAVFGNALHLVVANAADAAPRVKQYLSDRKINVRRIEKIRPTLEDVFVSLTTTRSGGGARSMSTMRLLAVATKEMVQILRDSRSLIIVVIMPVTLMFLFGYGVNLDLKGLPVYVYDQDGSQQSQDLLKRFQASEYFHIVRVVDGYSGVAKALDGQGQDGDCNSVELFPALERGRAGGSASADRRNRRQHGKRPDRLYAGVVQGYSSQVQFDWLRRHGSDAASAGERGNAHLVQRGS